MNRHLINVRLDESHLRKAQALRDHGVVISELVRDAIDMRFDALADADQHPDVKHMIAQLFVEHPDDVAQLPRAYDVHDRHAARTAIRQAIRQAMRRKSPKRA